MRVSISLCSLLVVLCACSGPETAPADGSVGAPSAPAIATPSSPATPLKLYTLDRGQMDFGDVDSFADDGSMQGVART